jgi:hypothetical protein
LGCGKRWWRSVRICFVGLASLGRSHAANTLRRFYDKMRVQLQAS